MAKTGRIPFSDKSYDEINDKINEYFDKVNSGQIKRVGWSHFASYIGLSLESFKAILNTRDGSGYIPLRELLKKACTRLRGVIETSDSFAGSNSSKGIFLLKQDVDGCAYQDKTTNESPSVAVKIEFGGGRDSFA